MATSSSQDNARQLPPLAPAPVGGNSQQPENPTQNVKISRGPRVGACNSCRTRKIKCNGRRPTCDKCAAAETHCIYVETESREARRKFLELRDRRNAHEEMLELLKSLPETDALEVLRRLKSGGDCQQILDQAKEGTLLMQLSKKEKRDSRYTLPFIAGIPDTPSMQEHDSPESSGRTRQDSGSVCSTTGSVGTDKPWLT